MEKDAASAENTWVDEVIAKLQGATNGILQVQVGNQTLSAFLGTEAVQYFQSNKPMLLNLGIDLFRQFLILVSEKKEEEAFNLLLSKMTADDIINRLTMDANELKKYNDDWDAFVDSLKKFAIQLLTSIAQKTLIGLLTTMLPIL